MTIEVPAKKVGDTLFTLHDLGFTPQINLQEDVPLGRNSGPVTAEELILQDWKPGEKKQVRDLTAQFASLGKAKSSVYTALNMLKKKGKVKNPSTGVWELST